MSEPFPDHFSSVAATYARYRPTYPEFLFNWIADIAPARHAAWDCGCGSGQATLPLAQRFEHVTGTDASAEQLRHAPDDPRIDWRAVPAESSGLDSASMDAITVAQALHWFDQPRFWTEVRRVSTARGVIVVWSYGIPSLDTADLTGLLRHMHDDVVGPYWPVERGYVDAGYQQIDFPFARITPPAMDLSASWTLDQLLGYLRSWSATRRYIEANHSDPVPAFADRIRDRYGDSLRTVRWPLTILAGRVE